MSLFAGIRSFHNQTNWGTEVPHELLLVCFGELEPEALIRSSGVCLSWHRASSEPEFYLKFAQRVKYFYCESESGSFAVDPKSLFIKHYCALKGNLPQSGSQTCYQALRHFQSSEGFSDLKNIWERFLPSVKEMSRKGFLANFPYQKHVATLRACVRAGALAIEDRLQNRLFYLSCFHGDVETLTLILEAILNGLIPRERDRLLKSGIMLAIEESQPCIIRYLKDKGQISVRSLILSNFDHADFAIGGAFVASAEFLEG